METRLKIADALSAMDEAFPTATQDDWDNSGLIVGNADDELQGILLTVDITEAVVNEAVARGCNLVIAHHPILFRGAKRIVGANDEQRLIIAAIRNNIALYASHTCCDKSPRGTSTRLAQMIGLHDVAVLVPESKYLYKIVTFVPTAHAERVRDALFSVGAGHIGAYSECSYNLDGHGTFRALEGTHPFVGAIGQRHTEPEVRIETIVPRHRLAKALRNLVDAHPYEEPAYDIYPLENELATLGYGAVGNLPEPVSVQQFLSMLKTTFSCGAIRHNEYDKPIRRVAVCTGSGSEFISNALHAQADAYITADMKYHQFAQADGRMLIADIGHYESEALTTQLFLEVLKEKIHKFAPCLITDSTNPIKYY